MAAEQPNILLITTDQQRYDAAGGAGPDFLRTPHYDRLRYEGIEFTRAYTDCAVCVPSRMGIMTGKQVFSHGMSGNGVSSKILGREGTLPWYLREQGYQTIAIGKMHFGPERARHGFDEMVLPDDYYRQMRHSGNDFQPMRHGLGQNELYPGMATVPEALTLTSWIAEQCVDYIHFRRDPSAPFFLWCSFTKPHPPFDPPEPYYSMYRNSPIPEPAIGEWRDSDDCPVSFVRQQQKRSYDLLPAEVIREARSAYYGLITQVDYNMSRVFAALEDLKLYHDTLIIYTSDHGEFLGDHRAGAKTYFLEPSAHVPFALRMPSSWENRCHGTQVQSPVTHADILPTLLKAAGGEAPDDSDGQDLVAVARGEHDSPRRYLEATHGPGPTERALGMDCTYLAITDGSWKYIWYPEGPAEQLFDIEADSQERHNLAHAPEAEAKKQELQEELIRRQQDRGGALLDNGALPVSPVYHVDENEMRDQGQPGAHTEYWPVDVRH
jgi:arylsulfatase A-like enzyme